MHEGNEKSEAELWELSVGEDVFTRAEALQELGVRCLAQGKHDEGLNFMNAALDVWRAQDDLVGIGRSCYAQGAFHLAHNRFEIAVPLLEEAVSSYHNAFRLTWEADALRALGSAYKSLGLEGIAQDMFIRAAAGYDEMNEYYRASLTEIDLGNTYATLFEVHMSLQAFQRALAFGQLAEDPVLVLRCNTRIASMFLALGEVDVPLEISRNSILTAEYLEDEELLNIVKNDLAETLVDLGLFAEALVLLEGVCAFWKSQRDFVLSLCADINRAAALHGIGRNDEAKQLLAQLAATAQNLDSKNNIINVALVTGDIELAEGFNESALGRYLFAAQVSAEDGNEPWLERYSWLQVAEAHIALGNLAEALEILDELTLEAWGDCLREQSDHRRLHSEILEKLSEKLFIH